MTTPGATPPPAVETLPALLDVGALARLLGMTESGARRLCRDGAVPARRIGRAYYVSTAALLARFEAPPRRRPAVAETIRGLPPPRRRSRNRMPSPMPSRATVATKAG